MRITSLVHFLFVGACAVVLGALPALARSPREHLSLDANWSFHLGDDWPDALSFVNSGTGSGPAAEKFADSYWRIVNLPHDWAVELPFDPTADGGHGFKPLGVKYPANSIAWYRRKFQLPASDSGKRIWLVFDGVMHDATVLVNGWIVQRHEGRLLSRSVEDITDVLHFGGETTVSVRVDATKSEGWFYEGAGIYRHVWLDVTAPLAIAPDGIFVYSTFSNNVPDGPATLLMRATLLNRQGIPGSGRSQLECFPPPTLDKVLRKVERRRTSEVSPNSETGIQPRNRNTFSGTFGPPKTPIYAAARHHCLRGRPGG